MTVAVSPADATRLVHGIQTGTLYAATRAAPMPRSTSARLFPKPSLFSK